MVAWSWEDHYVGTGTGGTRYISTSLEIKMRSANMRRVQCFSVQRSLGSEVSCYNFSSLFAYYS